MTKISLLQISDLHFFDPREPFTWWIPDFAQGHRHDARIALCNFVRTRGQEFDAIIVTGDVVESGTAAHLHHAHEILFPVTRPASSQMPLLDFSGASKDVYILPGNHDRFFEPSRLPGNDEFSSVFGAHWPRGLGQAQALTFPVPGTGAQVVVVAADFCLHDTVDASPWIYYAGQGTAGHLATPLHDSALERLKKLTERAKQRATSTGVPCAILWALHFPPAILPTLPGLYLNYHHRVLKLAKQLKVKLIIAGHLHVSVPFNGPDSVVWTAGAATAKWAALNTIHILDINIDNRGTVEVSRRNFELDHNSWQFDEVESYAPGNAVPGVSWQI